MFKIQYCTTYSIGRQALTSTCFPCFVRTFYIYCYIIHSIILIYCLMTTNSKLYVSNEIIQRRIKITHFQTGSFLQ